MGLTLTPAKKRVMRAIAEEPKHGYTLANELSVRGSTMYEHLEQLEKHEYVTGEQDGRRTVYSLTKKGQLIIKAEDHSG
jgi:DNA-binding MarR family transcriptional regulator